MDMLTEHTIPVFRLLFAVAPISLPFRLVFMFMVLHDAKKSRVPRRSIIVFSVLTFLGTLLGIVFYMLYKIIRQSKTGMAVEKTPPLRTLVIEVGLAIFVVTAVYLLARFVLSFDFF